MTPISAPIVKASGASPGDYFVDKSCVYRRFVGNYSIAEIERRLAEMRKVQALVAPPGGGSEADAVALSKAIFDAFTGPADPNLLAERAILKALGFTEWKPPGAVNSGVTEAMADAPVRRKKLDYLVSVHADSPRLPGVGYEMVVQTSGRTEAEAIAEAYDYLRISYPLTVFGEVVSIYPL